MVAETRKRRNSGISALSPKNPVTEHNPQGAGRKKDAMLVVDTQQVLNNTAPDCVRILRSHVAREKGFKHLAPDLHRTCEYIIDHAIGKARQKVEHSGAVLTYGEIAKSASALLKNPPKLLIEVAVVNQVTINTAPGAPELKSSPVEGKGDTLPGG